MRYILFFLLIVFLTACKKDPPLWEIKNLNNDRINVFGHGGMGIYSKYPIDSRSSLLEALNSGAAGVEMDVQMSSDSVLFLFHNTVLTSETDCDGIITDLSSSQISCNYQSVTSRKEPVDRLRLFFQSGKFNVRDHLYTIEVKLAESGDDAYVRRFSRTLAKDLTDLGIGSISFVESTSPYFLQQMKLLMPQLKLYLYSVDFDSALKAAKNMGLAGLTFDMHKISTAQVKLAHDNGIWVTLFNQKSEKDNLEAIQMNPDNVQSDRLDHLVDILNSN